MASLYENVGNQAEAAKWNDVAREKEPDPRWLNVFASHDVDRDRVLRPKEVAAALMFWGNASFHEVDADRDGRLEPNEFATWFQNPSGPPAKAKERWDSRMRTPVPEGARREIDQDGDKKVTREEIMRHAKRQGQRAAQRDPAQPHTITGQPEIGTDADEGWSNEADAVLSRADHDDDNSLVRRSCPPLPSLNPRVSVARIPPSWSTTTACPSHTPGGTRRQCSTTHGPGSCESSI